MSEFILQPNSRIGVFSPSSTVSKGDIEAAKAMMKKRGYEVFVHPQTYATHHQSAGTTEEKIKALHALYADENINVIWVAGGGNRAMDMLDHLDYALIAKNKKPLVGFSDATVLLNAIHAQTGHVNWHAQVFKNLHQFEALDETLKTLSGDAASMDLSRADIVNTGKAEGLLVGGCLSLFHYLPGTNDCPNLQDAILFLEDTGDEISRFDRMFLHMKRMGVFEQIGGLVLGGFHDMRDSGTPFGFELKDIVLDALDGRDIPIVMNAPFGHGPNLSPLPVGSQAILDTKKATLQFTV